MKPIYLFIFLAFLFSCDNPVESEDQTHSDNIEQSKFILIDVTEHEFYLKPIRNDRQLICFSLKASVINKSGWKLKHFSFYSSVELEFPNRTFHLRLEDMSMEKFDHPWLPNDTITVDFNFEGYDNSGWATAELIDYTPNNCRLKNNIRVSDVIENSYWDDFSIFDIKDEWVTFQNTIDTQKNKTDN